MTAEAADGNVVYDEHVVLVQVSITDNNDGTLGIETKMDEVKCPCFVCGANGTLEDDSDCPACKDGTITSNSDDLTFKNEYKPAGFDIQKTLEPGSGEDDPNHVFTFELELTNERGESVDGLADEFLKDGYYEPVSAGDSNNGDAAADEGVAAVAEGMAAANGDAAAIDDNATSHGDIAASRSADAATVDNGAASVDEHTNASAGNPIVAFGTWAMNALGSLFAPEQAYAAEPKAEPETHHESANKEWHWTFDETTGALVIGGTHISIEEAGGLVWPWHQKSISGKIKSVSFEQGSTSGTVLDGMFSELSSVETIDLANFNTSKATSMASMFKSSTVKSLDPSKLNTSCVTNMANMFNGCSELNELDCLKLDTSQVVSMNQMFRGCSSLQTLELGSAFNTENVTDMTEMFDGCESLKTLELGSAFNTENVTTMTSMFRSCGSLSKLDVSTFNTSNVEYMTGMFWNCKSLNVLDLRSFDTSKTTNMQGMFQDCEGLHTLTFGESFTAKNVKSFRSMFEGCKSLKALDLSHFATSNATDMYSMFQGCKQLEDVNMENFDTKSVKEMSHMFDGCENMKTVDVSTFDTSSVTSFMYMFNNCVRLSCLDVSNFTTVNAQNDVKLSGMFKSCGSKLNESEKFTLVLGGFDTSNATGMTNMFSGCTSLEELDVSKFNTSNVTDMSGMFSNCSSLKEIDVSNFDVQKVKNMDNMFSGCSALTTLDLTDFDTTSLKSMEMMFLNCFQLETLKLGAFDTSKVKSANNRFSGLTHLNYIYIESPFTFGESPNALLPTTYKWVKVNNPGADPAPSTPSYTAQELADTFPNSGEGWYMRDVFATFEFDADGGVGSAAPQKADVTKEVTLTAPNFVRFGYTLTRWQGDGWSFNEDENGKIVIDSSVAQILFKKANGKPIVLKAEWKKSGDSVTEENGKYTFKVPAGYVLHLPDVIPSGTSYRVRELTEDGWKLVASSGENGMISSENNETPLAQFVNARAAEGEPQTVRVELRALKTLDGAWANAGDGFTFSMTGYDPETGNRGTWTGTLHDGGTVTFPALEFSEEVLGGNPSKVFTYELTEVQGDNPTIEYDGRTVTATVTISKDTDGKLQQDVAYAVDSAGSPTSKPVAFTNKTKPGSLSITKQIEGQGSDVDNQEFSFMVTLDGKPFSGMYTVDGKSHTAADGIITLKGGATALIESLGAGTRYTVEEVDIPSGWQPVGEQSHAGIVGAGQQVVLTFTNEYSATGAVQLMAYKSFPGGELKEGQFEFALYEGKGESLSGEPMFVVPNGKVDMSETVPGPNGGEIENPHYGMAPAYFGDISYTESGKYWYTIVERVPDAAVNAAGKTWSEASPEEKAAGGFALDGVVYDSAVRYAQVTVTDSGKGTLDTKVVYEGSDGQRLEDAPVFTNTPQQVGLNLKKVVTNDFGEDNINLSAEFKFKVAFKSPAGDAITGVSYVIKDAEGKVGDKQQVPDNGIIALKANETAQFRELPYGASYTIEEQHKDGWSVNTGASSGNLTGTLTNPNTPLEVTVANTYDATGAFELKARKDYDGKLEDGMFTFSIAEVREGGETTVLQTVSNKGEAITFEPITYGLEDAGRTFTYKVCENPGEREDVAYDNTVYTAEVRVEDTGAGTLECAVTIRDEALNDVTMDGIVFTNRRTFQLPFTGGEGIGMAGVAVLTLGCVAYLLDRKRKRTV